MERAALFILAGIGVLFFLPVLCIIAFLFLLRFKAIIIPLVFVAMIMFFYSIFKKLTKKDPQYIQVKNVRD